MIERDFEDFYEPIKHRFRELRLLESQKRRRMVRRMVTEVEADLYAAKGKYEPIMLEHTATEVAKKEFGSLITIIGLAILTELVRYIVKKLIERWEKNAAEAAGQSA